VILSRLDHGNATLAGMTADVLYDFVRAKPRPVAKRGSVGLPRSAHIGTTLANLHCMPNWCRRTNRVPNGDSDFLL